MKKVLLGLLLASPSFASPDVQQTWKGNFEHVTKMETKNLIANVEIMPAADDISNVIVTCKAFEKNYKELDFYQQKESLIISGARQSFNVNATMDKNTVYHPHPIIMRDERQIPNLIIQIPRTCSLVLELFGGNWNISQTLKPAIFNLHDDVTVHVGDLHQGGDVNISGNGEFIADKIGGSRFAAAIHGCGEMTLTDMNVSKAHLSVTGSGNISISNGKVGTLSSEVTGSGKITVDNITYEPSQPSLKIPSIQKKASHAKDKETDTLDQYLWFSLPSLW